jgi:hypothetical protein
MHTLPHPEDVRETVLRAFSDLRQRTITRAEMVETILLRQGHYYGRAFRQAGLVATLTAETGALCICTDGGQVLHTIDLGAATEEGVAARAA